MAKGWKDLWGDYDPTDTEPKTKKSSGSKSEKWYYADGRDNEEDEKDRTILGFNTRYTEDDRGGTEYGGYGYSGYSGYYDGFDDSDTDWYRRGSWRYSRAADYSPSSQFRSTFSSRYYSSGGSDDAKNKAIRALRTLTRSANTIVDKAAGKQGYAVQFSAGADSNGVTAALNEDKQRVVFVSPDDLLATKTTEDEDAVVDALTGFVLLRVQIAQEVKPEIIRRINSTGLHTAAFRAVERMFFNKDKLAGIDAAAFGRETADDYLAGLLAKSMLTRLSRRNVVSNWGGFAPYFVRHAKKFAGVRENLEKAEKSVETVVCTLGYNMLADESQIELPKEINEITAKHLGAEVAPDELLDACRKLVAEIRAFFVTTGVELPAGAVESELTKMMEDAQKEQSREGGDGAMRELMEKLASAMGAAGEAGDKCGKLSDGAGEKDSEVAKELKQAVSLDQLIKNIEAQLEQLDRAKKLVDDARLSDASSVAHAARNGISYALSSRPQGAEALRNSGIKEAAELEKTVNSTMTIGGADAKEKIEKLESLLKTVCEKAAEFLKAKRTTLKKTAGERIEDMEARLAKAAEYASEAMARIDEKSGEIAALPDTGSEIVSKSLAMLENLKAMVAAYKNRVDSSRAKLPEYGKTLAAARTLSTIQKEFANASSTTSSTLNASGTCFHDNYTLHTDPMISRLSAEMAAQLNRDDGGSSLEDMMRTAVDSTMAANSITDMSFMAALINSCLKNLLSDNFGVEAEDLKKVAEELGVSTATLQRMISALRNAINANKVSTKAGALGTKLSEALSKAQAEFSPVDRHLFGDKIEAKTKLLTGESISHVNDEARNAAEEEYVAYLDHTDCKPKVVTRQEESYGRRGDHGQNIIKQVKTKNRSAIERIRNALQFQSGKRTLETHGLRSGDLDEGSLHKLGYDCEHIWSQKTMSKLPDVAVGILVDQSGSMSGPKIEQARELCITLAEAIQKITGVRLYVYGHTANTGRDDLVIYEHYTPAMGADLTKLGGITAHCNNYDGYAIKDVAKRLAADTAKKKYLFVIADGLPAGAGYGGDSAMKHVTSVCKFTRDRLKIGTYAFAVGVSGHYQSMFKRQYGDNHVVFVNNVMKCLPQIVRFLRNALQQERKLVSVED